MSKDKDQKSTDAKKPKPKPQKETLTDLGITEEAGASVKGGIPKQPDPG